MEPESDGFNNFPQLLGMGAILVLRNGRISRFLGFLTIFARFSFAYWRLGQRRSQGPGWGPGGPWARLIDMPLHVVFGLEAGKGQGVEWTPFCWCRIPSVRARLGWDKKRAPVAMQILLVAQRNATSDFHPQPSIRNGTPGAGDLP